MGYQNYIITINLNVSAIKAIRILSDHFCKYDNFRNSVKKLSFSLINFDEEHDDYLYIYISNKQELTLTIEDTENNKNKWLSIISEYLNQSKIIYHISEV